MRYYIVNPLAEVYVLTLAYFVIHTDNRSVRRFFSVRLLLFRAQMPTNICRSLSVYDSSIDVDIVSLKFAYHPLSYLGAGLMHAKST